MALIKTVRDHTPQWGQRCYIAENATLVGDLLMGDDCSIWFNAVVRADVNEIRIGNKVNVQDGAIIHGTYLRAGTYIGDEVTIGHGAIVHGCTLEDQVLIGMGAIVMDHTVVQTRCLIAAGAVVLEGTICESGYIYAGVPAKKLKELPRDLFEDTISRIANSYLKYAAWYKED